MRLRFAAPYALTIVGLACAHTMTPKEAEEACNAKRGLYFVDPRAEESPDGGEPAGRCIERAREGGRRCTSSSECGIGCMCNPADDGKKAVGRCAEYPPLPGSGWKCMIDEDGIAHAHGMIVGGSVATFR
jgi:hypothetical protein